MFFLSKEGILKIDRYTKVILTIIALCLLWICIKDIGFGPSKLYASPAPHPGAIDVNIVGVDSYAFQYAGPLEVTIE